MKHLFKLMKDCAGATAIEYALVASLISIAAIMAVGNIGASLNSSYANTANAL